MENETANNATADRQEQLLRGEPICPGIAIGQVHCIDAHIEIARDIIEPARIAGEQARYRAAVKAFGRQLHEHIAEQHEEPASQTGALLRAHEMMLHDEEFHTAVTRRIASAHKNAEWALEEEGAAVIRAFGRIRNPYLQARAEDIRDLVDHITRVLSDHKPPPPGPASDGDTGRIVVSGHLYPSDVVLAERADAFGFITESHALSSHAALLLRGFGIPAVGALPRLQAFARDGATIIVDATAGEVWFNPAPATLAAYRKRITALEALPTESQPVPCTTADGARVHLLANIENAHQASLAFQNGLEGIGLFRTEFLVLLADSFPDEEVQRSLYHEVIQAAGGAPVTIRTFDIGADKSIPSLHRCTGDNPALGVRGLRRHLLRQPDELRTQLRAILRAAIDSDVGILLPMVTTVDDIVEARPHLETVKADLRAERVAFNDHVRLGAMIEVPAAAIGIQAILQHVDFASIGTNDLLQYFMVADRDNEDVLHYNNAVDPSFQWLLRFVMEQAAAVGRAGDIMVCGEMASHPDSIPSLLHAGYRTLSVAPVSAPAVRQVIRKTETQRPTRQRSEAE